MTTDESVAQPRTAEEYRQWWREQRPDVPYGLCWCGCGAETRVSSNVDTGKKYFKGEPRMFVNGHTRGGKAAYTGNRVGYIYSLADPRDPDNVRYIGKTVEPLERRLLRHIDEKGETHKNRWIKKLGREGITPVIKSMEEVKEDRLCDREVYYITLYRLLGYDLTNGSDGGEVGGNRKGQAPWNKGKKLTPEQKKNNNMVKGDFRGKQSEELIKKRVEARSGYRHSEETKERIRQSVKKSHAKNPRTQETKDKISKVRTGYVFKPFEKLCACGCGETLTIKKPSHANRRYVMGHNTRVDHPMKKKKQ